MGKASDLIPILFWIVLGLLCMILSVQLGLQEFSNPGPGLMPFLLGLILFVLSGGYLLIRLSSAKKARKKAPPGEKGDLNLKNILVVLIALLSYSLIVERAGYPLTTFLLLTFLFRRGGSKWTFSVCTSLLTVGITYFVFSYLGYRFPHGIFTL